MSAYAALRPIVGLVPRYAHARRAGWAPPPELHGGMGLPEYILLRRIAIECDDGPRSYAELYAGLSDPYSTRDLILERLPRLVELGLINRSGDAYALAPAGSDVLMRGEPAANDYAARRIGLPPGDLARLAATLADVAERLLRAPEPADKAHQERVPRLRRFDRRRTPAVELEYALYALQRARDDAHLAAWRASGFRGPPFGLLSRVWAGASTLDELEQQSSGRLNHADVAMLLGELARDGYVELDPPTVALTAAGRAARDAIERETDRVFFTPWPELDAAWVCGTLVALAAGMAVRAT